MANSADSEIIRSMFSKVAANYDKANSILSLGIHHLWRKKLVQLSKVQKGQAVLDCATGTGDLAIEFNKSVGPEGQVIGTDFCPEMLAQSPAKALAQNLKIEFTYADVTQLHFRDNEFDIVSISFGIRNVADPIRALQEMARVCRPGGKVMILEFGQMTSPILSTLYTFYSEKIIPLLGGWVTGQKEAYTYLQKSSAAFPSREKFLTLMDQAQVFSKTSFKSVSFGIACIYIGTKK